MNLFETDLFGDCIKPYTRSVLADEFIEPPFSVLNGRNQSRRWTARKQAWLNMRIESEIGRIPIINKANNDSVSIFDPVLCEIMYSWFCPPGGLILDPFAGGSVRGVVANILKYSYYGIELSPTQVEANYKQANKICPGHSIKWIEGDSLELVKHAPECDFLFTCPPYGNLEVYSDDKRDISNMTYDRFIDTLDTILCNSIMRLRGEYACIVVSNFRDDNGYYHNFVGDTVSIFESAGMKFYNDMILLTPIGSAMLRVKRTFKSQKVVKVHQNILVFKR